jgi:ribosomal protein L44E
MAKLHGLHEVSENHAQKYDMLKHGLRKSDRQSFAGK